jgi:hypothetical protein
VRSSRSFTSRTHTGVELSRLGAHDRIVDAAADDLKLSLDQLG